MALLNHERPLWALMVGAPLVAMVSTASYAQTWKINLRDADLTAFINEVADITGKTSRLIRGCAAMLRSFPTSR